MLAPDRTFTRSTLLNFNAVPLHSLQYFTLKLYLYPVCCSLPMICTCLFAKNFILKTQIWTIEKKRDYKNFLISEWFIRFQHKNKRKIRQKIWKFCIVKNCSIIYRINLEPLPFFPIKIKWILSTTAIFPYSKILP